MQEHFPFPLYLLFYSILVVFIAAVTLGLSWVAGERRKTRKAPLPYESGIPPFGTARLSLYIEFYIIALLFVIFDVESAFIFAWAVALRETGWAGLIEMVIFILVLLVALFFLLSRKALQINPRPGAAARKEMAGAMD